MKSKLLLFCFIALLFSSLAVVSCAEPAPAPAPTPAPTPAPAPKEIVIKGITGLPTTHGLCKPVQPWIDKVNEQGKGMFRIELRGGPEVIPSLEQGDALRTGTIDLLLWYPGEWMESLAPACLAAGLSKKIPSEQRNTGETALWQEYYAGTVNAYYMGRVDGDIGYVFYINKRVEKIEDLKGLMVRGTLLNEGFAKALGVTIVLLPHSETYTAIERGTVDGVITTLHGAPGFSYQEVTKYILFPMFLQGSAARFMNLDVWNSLPPEAQDLLIQSEIEDETIVYDYQKGLVEECMKIYEDAGIEIIELPPDDAKKFLDLAYSTTWDYVISKAPVWGPKFREISQ